jgi:hypothetical protein
VGRQSLAAILGGRGVPPQFGKHRGLPHPAGGYNSLMRKLLLCLVLTLVMGQAAFAAGDGSPSATGVERVSAACAASARDCCHRITVACIVLKYRPLCDYPPHRCPMPYTPCDDVVCSSPPCHMPAVPCIPEAPCISTEPVCHKPVVVVVPEDPCEE